MTLKTGGTADENSVLHHRNKLYFTNIRNCIFAQINTALMSIRDSGCTDSKLLNDGVGENVNLMVLRSL